MLTIFKLMKNYCILTFLIFFSCSNLEENKDYDSVTILESIELPLEINETSGLEFYKDGFMTHNDSGGEPSIYFFDKQGDELYSKNLNEYTNEEIKNNDWEDIASDDNYIYIADTGNNFGTRKNLNILKIRNDEKFVIELKIDIKYSDQNSFIPSAKHKYDAEALLIINEKIALFSKDRESLKTQVYLIDSNNSEQILTSIAEFEIGSLVTGGDYNNELNLLSLVSYSSRGEQYLILFKDFNSDNFQSNSFIKYKIPVERSQIEAVKIIDDKTFWVTSEDEGLGSPYMYKLGIEKNALNKTN